MEGRRDWEIWGKIGRGGKDGSWLSCKGGRDARRAGRRLRILSPWCCCWDQAGYGYSRSHGVGGKRVGGGELWAVVDGELAVCAICFVVEDEESDGGRAAVEGGQAAIFQAELKSLAFRVGYKYVSCQFHTGPCPCSSKP